MTLNDTLQLTRNQAIYQALEAGKTTREVAEAYNLSERRVRAIRSEFALQQTSTKPASKTGEVGLSGLQYSWGYVTEEFLTDLNTPAKRHKVYNEMRQNDAVIAATLRAAKLLVSSMPLLVEGDDDDPRKEFVQGALEDMSHTPKEHFTEALSMLEFGYSWFEIVYKRRQGERGEAKSDFNDGKIGWRKMAGRSQASLESWQFDERGNVTAFLQRTYPDFVLRAIPIEKSILYRTSRENNNPEGVSLLRPAYVPYYYAKNLRAIEAIGAERDLAGLPMVMLPENADNNPSGDDVTKAEKLVRRVRMDEAGGLVVPHGWDFKLLGSPGGKQFQIGDIIQRHETRMTMNMLASFLLLGLSTQTGTFALSKNLTEFFVMACTHYADILTDTFSQYAIPRLLTLNGMPLQNAPRLSHGPIGTADLDGISEFFNKLGGKFIEPNVDTEQWLREMVEAPTLSDDVVEIRKEREQEKREAPAPTPPPAPAPGQQPPTAERAPEAMPDDEQMPMAA